MRALGDRVRHSAREGGALGSVRCGAVARGGGLGDAPRLGHVRSRRRRHRVHFNGTLVDSDRPASRDRSASRSTPDAGHIWVADPSADRVVAYDRNGQLLFRVDGLSDPVDLTVDLPSGEAWVVLPSAGRVARIAPDGRVLRQLGGFGRPNDVAVEP